MGLLVLLVVLRRVGQGVRVAIRLLRPIIRIRQFPVSFVWQEVVVAGKAEPQLRKICRAEVAVELLVLALPAQELLP